MSTHNTNRRDFVKKSSLGILGLSLAPSFIGKMGPH
ncbi:MAG: twin-arginine translocation signal domain-containing protein, partial [Maribacter sp.]|nr:twin-arginine translocation signal domain-containing protein [Maribacter sp.]